MLHIVKIQNVLFPFFGFKLLFEKDGKVDQRLHLTGAGFQILILFLKGGKEILFREFRDPFLHPLP